MSDDPDADYVIASIPLTGPGTGYWGLTPVPSWAVYDAIAVLQCHVARYSGVGMIPDETGITRLLLATCRTLAALVEANMARDKNAGIYELCEQLDRVLGFTDIRRDIEAMRPRGVDPDIIEALLALEPRIKAKRPQRGPASARSPEAPRPAEGDNHGCGE
jgi:hypothetical protein